MVRIRADRDGPLLVEGPVEVTGPDGDTVVSRRFVVAICTCRRSRTYPWCDTSHRRRGKPTDDRETGPQETPGDRETGRREMRDEPEAGRREMPEERQAGCGRTPDDQDRERKETRA
ncbi:CDGSH iron-sulfur domain-containing protein [Streptomyces sp. NPDC093984]|uniref:CDGSH iron-sulfur domain-containing protein n=1 Tax=Streptomyces sp. NPDC093984 TaxID=3366052 RepID=UPI0037F7750C